MTDLPKHYWYFPHDRFFKKAMSYPKVAQEFFQRHLPQALQARMDLTHLAPQNTSFVSKKLQHQETDLLFATTIDNKPAYIYLLAEHQSTSEYWLPLRVHQYQAGILEHHRMQHPEMNKLPVVVTVVLYNGKTPYNQPLHLRDLFEDPALAEYYHSSQFLFVDLNTLDDQDMRRSDWAGLMEFMLKHARVRQALSLVEAIRDWFPILEAAKAYDFIELIFCYTVANSHGKEEIKQIVHTYENQLSSTGGQQLMSALQEYIDEQVSYGIRQGLEQGIEQGIEKGRQQGLKQTAYKMLLKGMPIKDIQEVTGLSIKQIQQLKKST